jgi:hypothetical protein
MIIPRFLLPVPYASAIFQIVKPQYDKSSIMGSSAKAQLRPGAYAATLTFFKPDTEELDFVTLKKHVIRLGQAGLSGIIALGSNGEAAHLTSSERKDVVRTVRQSLNGAWFGHTLSTSYHKSTLELPRDRCRLEYLF